MIDIQQYNEWDETTVITVVKRLCITNSTLTKLKNLNNLPSLESIDASGSISTALMFIGDRIHNLNHLTYLKIGDCKYGSIYPKLLRLDLFPKTLTYLNMAHINLRDYPLRLDIWNLENLQTLILSHTGIKVIPKCPKSLRFLDVSSNDIEWACLLFDKGDMANLETLVIHGNENISLSNTIPLHVLLF